MIYNTNDIRNALKSAWFASTLDRSMTHNTYRLGYQDALKTVALAFGIENIEGITLSNEVIDGECALLVGEPSA